jgi:uncharacterized repeat protein (TIGR01451 family)
VTPLAIDLSVTKTASQVSPEVGQPVSFTVQITNSPVAGSPATTATGVTVLDPLPAGFSFSTSSATQGTYSALTGIWTVGSLGVGANASLTITGVPTTTVPITNVAQVNSADQVDVDSVPGNSIATEDDQDSVTITPIQPPRPAIAVVKSTNGLAPNSATGGPVVPVGSTVTLRYVVTNAGDVPLAGVQVRDDNGTAANTADDFFATFVTGDANSNSLLDLTETWDFQAQRTATPGNHVNRARATAVGNNETVSADTVSNHTAVTIGQPRGKRRLLASRFRT